METQQLELVLAQDIDSITPAMIGFNNEELLAMVRERMSTYVGRVYSDEQIAEAKKDRATLNAFIKRLDEVRKGVKKVYERPYLRFKEQVDQIINEVNQTVTQIDSQIVAAEQEKADAKKADILEYFTTRVGDLAGQIDFSRVFNPKWLNLTCKMKDIRSEIDAIVTNAENAMVAIKALHSDDESTICAFYFRTLDLAKALQENERLKQERANAAKAVAIVEKETPQQIPEKQILTIEFAVTADIGKLMRLKAFLIENGYDYEEVKH